MNDVIYMYTNDDMHRALKNLMLEMEKRNNVKIVMKELSNGNFEILEITKILHDVDGFIIHVR